MKIRINFAWDNTKNGSVIEIEDKDGVPESGYWRKRLRESKFDGCIEIVSENPVKSVIPKKQKEKEKEKGYNGVKEASKVESGIKKIVKSNKVRENKGKK